MVLKNGTRVADAAAVLQVVEATYCQKLTSARFDCRVSRLTKSTT